MRIGGSALLTQLRSKDHPLWSLRSESIRFVDRGIAVLFMAVVGGLVAMQAPVNAGLGKTTGDAPAALVSFIVGTLVLAAIVVVIGQAGEVSSATEVQWYYLIGGALGAAYVYTSLAVVHTIGAGGVAAATITGQLVTSVALDRIGFLGLEQLPLTAARLTGVVLLIVGTYLVVR